METVRLSDRVARLAPELQRLGQVLDGSLEVPLEPEHLTDLRIRAVEPDPAFTAVGLLDLVELEAVRVQLEGAVEVTAILGHDAELVIGGGDPERAAVRLEQLQRPSVVTLGSIEIARLLSFDAVVDQASRLGQALPALGLGPSGVPHGAAERLDDVVGWHRAIGDVDDVQAGHAEPLGADVQPEGQAEALVQASPGILVVDPFGLGRRVAEHEDEGRAAGYGGSDLLGEPASRR